jgi:flagellar protein FlgJ
MTLPALPLVDPNQLVAAGNLSELKRAAAKSSPQALREAARQFESLFVSMVLKSAREANFKDPLFGSDQGDLYQDMYDEQVAAAMSSGKGLGLADMLVQQLRRQQTDITGPASTSRTEPGAIGGSTASAGAPATSCPTAAQQAAFARALWPDAQRAARQLGVSPVSLLAQAALETDWGRSVPQDASGGSSNNLFGIKAGSRWSGPAVESGTHEYAGGAATSIEARFRAYGSATQCFQDYVALLRADPRYAPALGTGDDVQAFGSALQQGGYATDPGYASKLSAVAGTLTRALKFAAGLPTTGGSGALQRR